MIEKLIEFITKTQNLNMDDERLIHKYFEVIKVDKNSILEEATKIPQHLFFVISGYARLFYYDDNGDEVTTYLSAANNYISSFISFANQTKSTEYLECISNCMLLMISHKNMKELIDKSDNFKTYSVTIFEKSINTTSERANDLATLNGKERYNKFITNYPKLIQNIPVQYIASYLGMKPESLSRIRKKLIS